MPYSHTPGKLPGAYAYERKPVPVSRIHIGLNFEHEGAETLRIRHNDSLFRQSRRWWRREGQKVFQKSTDTEIGKCAAEINRTQLALQHRFDIERFPCHIQQFDVMAKLFVDIRRQQLRKGFIRQISHGGLDDVAAMRPIGLEQFHLFQLPVINTLIIAIDPHRPIHRIRAYAENFFQFVHQFERVFAVTIDFVNKSKDRNMALPADLKQLACLLLDAFGGIDQHHGAIGRHQGSVCIFAEILVTGCIENIDATAVIFELHHARCHRNAALLLNFHPVGYGKFLGFTAFDRACQANCTAI